VGVPVESGTGGRVGLDVASIDGERVGVLEVEGTGGRVGDPVVAGLGGTVSPGQKMVSGGMDSKNDPSLKLCSILNRTTCAISSGSSPSSNTTNTVDMTRMQFCPGGHA